MKSDKFLELVLIGIVCVIPHEINTLILKKLHVTTISAFEVCSMMFMLKPSWFLGILALPSVGVLGVTSFYYLAKGIGAGNLLLKTTIYAMTINALIFEVFGTLARNQNMIQDVAGNFGFAVSTAFTGFIAGVLMKKYIYCDEVKRPPGKA